MLESAALEEKQEVDLTGSSLKDHFLKSLAASKKKFFIDSNKNLVLNMLEISTMLSQPVVPSTINF